MALVVKHTKVSGIADDPGASAAGEILPSDWNANHTLSGQASLSQGGTGSDLSATGGPSQVLKQTSTGAAFTVGQLTASDISGLPFVTIESQGGGTGATAAANSAALAAIAANGNVVVKLAAGTYNFNANSSITKGNVIIEGAGQGITILSWTTGVLLTFDGGFSRIYGCGVRKCTLNSSNATNNKTGILVIDGSGFTIEDMAITGAGTNSILTGANSIGLQTKGREFLKIRGQVTIAADKPVVISKNPNSYLSCDLYEFGSSGSINLIGGTANPVLTVDPGVAISNSRFQADFELGTHGFYWNDTGTYNNVSAINAAGSAYTAGDVLTVSGGTGTAATIRVVTVDGGGTVTSAAIVNPGAYSGTPSMPVSVTGGTGTGATFTLNNVVSNNLTIRGRAEQGASTSSNNIYIAPQSSISIVNIDDFSFDGSRKGLFLKNTIGTTLTGTTYVPSGATEGINADTSNEAITFVNTRWYTGTTSLIASLAYFYKTSPPTGYALPPFACYSATASGFFITIAQLLNGAIFTGASSGTTTLQAAATASGTLTLPAATDTLIAKATTDTLTNKTYDTAGPGNVFKINGTQISAITGSGSAVLATAPVVTGLGIGRAALTDLQVGNEIGAGSEATNHGNLMIDSGQTDAATNGIEWRSSIASSGYGFRMPTVYDGGANMDLKIQSRQNSASWTDIFLFKGATNAMVATNGMYSISPTKGIGYATGAGGTITQTGSRTTGVTLNTVSGAITLVSAAGSTSFQKFTVTNSAVAATDTIIVNQTSGTDRYHIFVTAIGAGSFDISFATISGTTTEQPVFNFNVIKGVTS